VPWCQGRRGRLGPSQALGEQVAGDHKKRALGSARAGWKKFGWEHRLEAALVRHCVLAGFSCLPVAEKA
jgi:hypothetical protein